MATDPAVQAAAEAYADLAKQRGLAKRVVTVADTIDAIVPAVTPLIRRQAFNEAADKIRGLMDRQPLFDERDTCAHDIYGEVLRLIRGLGEGTENA